MKCKDLYNFPSLQSMEIIAGTNGLDNNVRWIYFWDTVAIEDCIKWIESNELIIITGSSLASNLAQLPNYFDDLVSKHIAGIIVNVGPFIQKVPDSVCEAANRLNIPIFTLPWEVPLIKATREICNAIIVEEQKSISRANLFKTLLFDKNITEDELSSILLDNSMTSQLELHVGVLRIQANKQDESTNEFRLYQKVCVFFDNNHLNIKSTIYDNNVIFFVRDRFIDNGQFVQTLKDMKSEVFANASDISCFIGVGETCLQPFDYRNSYEHADKICDTCIRTGDQEIAYYNNPSITGLLTFANDNVYLENFFNKHLSPIIKYDATHNSSLLETLLVFVENDLSFVETANKLFIHKNTLRYRIEKVEELLGYKLTNSSITNILIAKEIKKFLGH